MSARRALVIVAVLVLAGIVLVLSRAAAHNADAVSRRFAPASTVRRVTMRRTAYWPARLEVAVGDTVEWANDDIVTHTASADDGKTFDSPDLAPSQSWRTVVTAPGTFTYHCALHPTMKGTVVAR